LVVKGSLAMLFRHPSTSSSLCRISSLVLPALLAYFSPLLRTLMGTLDAQKFPTHKKPI
jgi:hypothetical protein